MMNNNTEVLRVEENGIELFTVVATGESGMSQRGLARACGKHIRAIQKIIENLTNEKAPKRLQRFIGKELTLTHEAIKKGGKVIVYRADFCSAVIKHYAYLGSESAQDIDEATGEIGLTSYIQGKTRWLPEEYQSSEEARESVNRILSKPCPYAALYRKDMCDRAFKWFGANFYWDYFYFWMTEEERAKLEVMNPVVNGQRKTKIHQWIEGETKERLRDKAIELRSLVMASLSPQRFIESFQNLYGGGWQMDMFE